jgi:hypothetical protein
MEACAAYLIIPSLKEIAWVGFTLRLSDDQWKGMNRFPYQALRLGLRPQPIAALWIEFECEMADAVYCHPNYKVIAIAWQ